MANYVNGIFLEEKEGPFGTFLSIGISEEGLKAIQALPKTSKGFRNMVASRQKERTEKFSVKPYEAKPTATPLKDDDDGQDLPF